MYSAVRGLPLDPRRVAPDTSPNVSPDSSPGDHPDRTADNVADNTPNDPPTVPLSCPANNTDHSRRPPTWIAFSPIMSLKVTLTVLPTASLSQGLRSE